MRKAGVNTTLNIPTPKLWDLLIDIDNYPKYIEFVHSVETKSKSFEKGSIWYDWSTIMFVPLKIKHVVEKVEKQKELGYNVPMLIGGLMEQRFSLEPQKDKTKIIAEIRFDFNNKLLNTFLGPLLQKRLQYMLEKSIQNFNLGNNG